jgi:hypothetical protein
MQVSSAGRRPQAVLLLIAIFAALGILALAAWALVARGAPANRQAEVAARGAAVMPFDLERTTHIFDDLPDGGLQQVVADDETDTAQIALIRVHLREEAVKFQRGDFGDPAAIHGDATPSNSRTMVAGRCRVFSNAPLQPHQARLVIHQLADWEVDHVPTLPSPAR